MDQPSKPDLLIEALRQRDEGIQRAVDHADRIEPSWSEQARWFALRFFKECEMSPVGVTTEDLREAAIAAGIPAPPDGRAWGGIVRALARRGLIRRIGFATARDPKVHCNMVALWRSA